MKTGKPHAPMAVDSAGALADASTGRAVHPQQIDMTPPHQQEAYAHTGVLPHRLAALQRDTTKIAHRYMFALPHETSRRLSTVTTNEPRPAEREHPADGVSGGSEPFRVLLADGVSHPGPFGITGLLGEPGGDGRP